MVNIASLARSVQRAPLRSPLRQPTRLLSGSSSDGDLFLGLDSSTQGLKATAINNNMEIVFNTAINFEKDLPHYATTGGFHQHEGDRVTAPTIMFAEALDIVLGKLHDSELPLEKVTAISGSGQQHGSVYFKQGAGTVLQNLSPGSSFEEQLRNNFSVPDSPIWRDSSTTAQCRQLEAAVGGPEALSKITGSRAYERFTGNQILKIVQDSPDLYAQTERISLISSFMCSLLLGDYASIDSSDGAGMNMMDLKSQDWSEGILQAIAPDLSTKLGPVNPAHSVLGNISMYLSNRYGFQKDCKIVAWSGDNPCSVAGLGLRNPGDIGLSLGTSDTVFSIVDAAVSKPALQGHTFINPVDPNSHMAMLCYKNGSLTRENVRENVKADSWDDFNSMVLSTPPGNNGNIGFYIDQPEIIPDIPIAGVRRFDSNGAPVAAFDPAVDARAVIEGQMLSMRTHTASLGVVPKVIVATGGGSANPVITQIMSDVFGVPVQVSSQTDSASLGAALRARHGFECHQRGTFVPYADVTGGCPSLKHHTVAEPSHVAHSVYTDMLSKYKEAESKVLDSCN